MATKREAAPISDKRVKQIFIPGNLIGQGRTTMETNPIGELMQSTMENVKNILKVDTVVGDPIYTPDGIRKRSFPKITRHKSVLKSPVSAGM